MESLINSLKFFQQSLAFLFRNFDVLILTTLILSLVIYMLVYFKNVFVSYPGNPYTLFIIFGTYFLCCFLITYYETILIIIFINRLNANKISLLSGVYTSVKYFFSILYWSFVLATLGLFNKIWSSFSIFTLVNFFNDRYFSFPLGKVLTSWNFSSYFVLPFLVSQNGGILAASKQSDLLFGPGWRKNIKVSSLIGIAGFITIITYLYISKFYIITPSMHILTLCILIAVYTIIAVTFNAIEKSALYTSYVLHQWSHDFKQGLLNSAFTKMSQSDELF